MKTRNPLSAYRQLCKVKISLLSSFSAAAGFALSAHAFRPSIWVATASVFLLACGASALNQFQERGVDALMTRTRNRPVPSGRITPGRALAFSIVLMASGLSILLLSGYLISAALAVFAVIWYNGVYTWLKKKTAFAVIPGALTGVISPAIGWTAAGGGMNTGLLMLCFLFFMWQVPHFWLFIASHGEDYKRAGLPSLTDLFGKEQLGRIVCTWMAATAVSGLLILQNSAVPTPSLYPVAILSLWLMYCGADLLRKSDMPFPVLFNRINIYMVLLLTCLSVNSALL